MYRCITVFDMSRNQTLIIESMALYSDESNIESMALYTDENNVESMALYSDENNNRKYGPLQ